MRELLLQGNIELPGYQKFVARVGLEATQKIEALFNAMWFNYLKDKGSVNLTYWADRFKDEDLLHTALMSLSKAGWITSHAIPARNWAEAWLNEDKLLDYLAVDELTNVRAHHKLKRYMLNTTESKISTKVRLNGKLAKTGLVRNGFTRAGNTKIKYDTNLMFYYRDSIQHNLTKSMDKIAAMYPEFKSDAATYDSISKDVLAYLIDADIEFTSGPRESDSRGRDIHGMTGKIANPISCKDFRALMVIPE